MVEPNAFLLAGLGEINAVSALSGSHETILNIYTEIFMTLMSFI